VDPHRDSKFLRNLSMLALVAATRGDFMSVPVNRIAVGIGLFTALSMERWPSCGPTGRLRLTVSRAAGPYPLAISAFMSPISSRVISPRAYRSLRISNAPLPVTGRLADVGVGVAPIADAGKEQKDDSKPKKPTPAEIPIIPICVGHSTLLLAVDPARGYADFIHPSVPIEHTGRYFGSTDFAARPRLDVAALRPDINLLALIHFQLRISGISCPCRPM